MKALQILKDSRMNKETLLELTSDIVSAHVSNNTVAVSDLPQAIQSIYTVLSQLGQSDTIEQPALTPAVTVRSSVKPDAITCLECGRKLKMLKRHISTDHNLTPAEYRARWDLKADYPLVAPNYAATRAELAKSIGLGRKPGQKVKASAPGKVAAPKAKLAENPSDAKPARAVKAQPAKAKVAKKAPAATSEA